MEIKEINNIYFSPTYSTEKVVQIVGNVLSDKSTNIDLSLIHILYLKFKEV